MPLCDTKISQCTKSSLLSYSENTGCPEAEELSGVFFSGSVEQAVGPQHGTANRIRFGVQVVFTSHKSVKQVVGSNVDVHNFYTRETTGRD